MKKFECAVATICLLERALQLTIKPTVPIYDARSGSCFCLIGYKEKTFIAYEMEICDETRRYVVREQYDVTGKREILAMSVQKERNVIN